jgi:hypothetical protein
VALTLTPGTPGSTGTGNVTSVSVAIPANKAGDITIVCMFVSGSSSMVTGTPAGWTPLFGTAGTKSAANTACGGNVFWRAWQTGDPTTQAFTNSTSSRMLLLPVLVRGANLTTPIETVTSQSPGANVNPGVAIAAPTLTATSAKALLCVHGVVCAVGGVVTVWTPPAGMTKVIDGTSGHASASNGSGLVSSKAIGAGATGVQNATADRTITALAFSVLLNAATASTVMRGKGGGTVTTRYKGQP